MFKICFAIVGRAVLAAMLIALAASGTADAQTRLKIVGGAGGGAFTAICPVGKLLWGFELRVADDVDALAPVCARALGPSALSEEEVLTPAHGGDGGRPLRITCPLGKPVVVGMKVEAEGRDTVIVNNIALICGLVTDGDRQAATFASARFDGPANDNDGLFQHFSIAYEGSDTCPPGEVAIGVHGRSGIWLDAVGLICGPSPIRNKTVVTSIGRVNTGPPTKPGKKRTICQAADDAEIRKSPAAPNLRAQCTASRNR